MALQPLTIHDLKFLEGREPSLRICSWGSAGHDFKVYVLTKEGLEERLFTSSSDRSHNSSIFRLTNLPMMVSVRTPIASCRRGELFVRAQLEFGGIRAFDLFRGYLTYDLGFTWPLGVFESMVEGAGRLRSVTGTDPAAGAEFSESVPTNARWRLLGVRVDLVTDATVATRRVILLIDNGTNELHRLPASPTQAESLTRKYSFSPVGFDTGARDTSVICGLPDPLFLFQGWRVRSTTVNLQAGDNYGAPQMLIEEWIEE